MKNKKVIAIIGLVTTSIGMITAIINCFGNTSQSVNISNNITNINQNSNVSLAREDEQKESTEELLTLAETYYNEKNMKK